MISPDLNALSSGNGDMWEHRALRKRFPLDFRASHKLLCGSGMRLPGTSYEHLDLC